MAFTASALGASPAFEASVPARTARAVCEPSQPAKARTRSVQIVSSSSLAPSGKRRVLRRVPAVVQSSRTFEESDSLFHRFTTMRVSSLRRRVQRAIATPTSSSQQSSVVRMEAEETGDASKQNFITGLFRGWGSADADEDEEESSASKRLTPAQMMGDMDNDDGEYEDDMFPAPSMNGSAGGYGDDADVSEEYEDEDSGLDAGALGAAAAAAAPGAGRRKSRGGGTGLMVDVVEPKEFSVEMANETVLSLQESKCVILNLSSMSRESADKFFSYVSGGCFALGLNHVEIAEDVFFFGPAWAKLTVVDGSDREQQGGAGLGDGEFAPKGSSGRGLGSSGDSLLFPQLDWD